MKQEIKEIREGLEALCRELDKSDHKARELIKKLLVSS